MNDLYEVTDVAERTRYTPGGNRRRIIEVSFRTRHGATGQIRIPSEELSKETLDEALRKRASELEVAFSL